jgi:ApbE superfamily uncharacterized protein (UPF0280 family)
MGPVQHYLDSEGTPMRRLHLQYGPIDLVLGVDCADPAICQKAHALACQRFDGLLEQLVDELPILRRAADLIDHSVTGPVAKRMIQAVAPFKDDVFVTPMAAVAGSVADDILFAMTSQLQLDRAYVNNGGDIALHLSPNARFTSQIIRLDGRTLGNIEINANDNIGGIATSGQQGRSLSMGIADSVTVLASNAAMADVAATLICNAADLPCHPNIHRAKASDLVDDTDLGHRLVVRHVGALSACDIETALGYGRDVAQRFVSCGLIQSAALFLKDNNCVVGQNLFAHDEIKKEVLYA